MRLFAFAPTTRPRWPLALQTTIAVGAPIAVGMLVGPPMPGFIAASGAFTLIFGAALPSTERARLLPPMALGLILSAAAGVAVSFSAIAVAIGLVLVAAAAAFFAYGFRLGPPGPVFFVLLYGLAANVVGTGAVGGGVFLGALAAGCAFSYLLAISALALPSARAIRPRRLGELISGPVFDADSRILVIRVALTAVVGTMLGLVIETHRLYWIVAASTAVIGFVAHRRGALQRAVHRSIGTIAGIAVYALLVLLHPQGALLVLIMMALQFLIEISIVRHYALALMFITPLVFLLLSGASGGATGGPEVIADRLIDTIVGAGLGAASALLHPRHNRPAP